MGVKKIDKLIINSPYEEPKFYWSYERLTRSFILENGRRPARYMVSSPKSKSFDDPGIAVNIPIVNKIRTRVKKWRDSSYPGITGITRRLLEHWYNHEARDFRRFFFCQLEAIETIIWLVEAPESEKVGMELISDGGPFERICSKMATGSGKTVVMTMLIAWQILNKVTYPHDPRFSKYILVIAPGITIKNRLQVLKPWFTGNYYDEFSIIPTGLYDKLRQGRILIHNWHTLNWETNEQIAKKKSVDKRGEKSDEAYVREVLGEMANASNLIVINDEAHHAWRVPSDSDTKGISKDEIEEATKWIGGLDRIHRSRRILKCYDFSATPYKPSGRSVSEEALYSWIVSDFGLNDSIESGLVKTPRVVIRDDGKLSKDYKSRLYHIYNDSEVKDNINRRAEENEPLPDLIINAYYLLGLDWSEASKIWKKQGMPTPPVMISVANRVETAARIKYSFDHKKINIEELCDHQKTLHIDSKVLEKAESMDRSQDVSDIFFYSKSYENLTKDEYSELLRMRVDTVGQIGKPGEQIQNVISVGMLSEGWDAKTVTHIMGLRAFSSQLLCEQVIGRGLRRTSYEVNSETGLFDPEYVNVFGVPFAFLPHEKHDGPPPPPPTPKTRIEPDDKKIQYILEWPNIIRINHTYHPNLSINIDKVKPIILDPSENPTLAELAPIIDGKPDFTKISEIDLRKLGEKQRMQRIIFQAARDVFERMNPNWKGNKEVLLAQIIKIVEEILSSNKIKIGATLFKEDEIRRRLLITLNMNKIVQHIWEQIRFENTESIEPIFDPDRPIRSTSDLRVWYTGKPCQHTKKSHINFCVFDSHWEATEAGILDKNPYVEAWAKNDHLGFEIAYVFNGVVKKYWPDFIIKLTNKTYLILETKGKMTQRDKTKFGFLEEWVNAVNQHGGFGKWQWAVSTHPSDLERLIKEAISE